MSKTLIAIRTYRWSEEEQRLFDRLSEQALDAEIVVAFQNRPEDVSPPLPVIDVTSDWAEERKLRTIDDWGWRCGDYFFYAMREARSDCDHYWLIEPDVFFTQDPQDFFRACAADQNDILGFRPSRYEERGPYARGLPGMDLYRSIFALTRISGRAIDRLFEKRIKYCETPIRQRAFTNDELFVYSHIMADPELTVGDLGDIAPSWFDKVQFATNPDLIIEAVPQNFDTGRIFHPVRSHEGYCRAMAQRLTTWPGYLPRSQSSIAHLTDEDIEQIVALAGERMKQMLISVRG